MQLFAVPCMLSMIVYYIVNNLNAIYLFRCTKIFFVQSKLTRDDILLERQFSIECGNSISLLSDLPIRGENSPSHLFARVRFPYPFVGAVVWLVSYSV